VKLPLHRRSRFQVLEHCRASASAPEKLLDLPCDHGYAPTRCTISLSEFKNHRTDNEDARIECVRA
jgi:hypothetical protein